VSSLPLDLWVEGDAVSSSLRDVRLALSHTNAYVTQRDQVAFTVPTVDIEFPGLTEASEEEPGLYINVNWDDDDGDGWKVGDQLSEVPPNAQYTGDKADDQVTLGDDDLRSFTTSVSPGDLPGGVTLTYPANVKVWSSNTKKKAGGGSSFISSGHQFAVADLPVTLYLEGLSASDQFRDIELRAEYTEAPDAAFDVVKVTCFEATALAGFFDGPQQGDNDKKHHLFGHSSDVNGIISWDDPDPNCEYFHNCMEFRATVKPAGIAGEVQFDIGRHKWRRGWYKVEGHDWYLASPPSTNPPPWRDDDATNNDEDLSPSASAHIYSLDGPGYPVKQRNPWVYDYLAHIADYREFVRVKIGSQWYRCSDFYKWHAQIYIKPKDAAYLTRDVPERQKLGGGWITIPNMP